MTNQDRQSAPFPRWEQPVHPRRRGSLTAAHRGERWGDGRYLAAYRRLLARHRRLIRLVGIVSGTLWQSAGVRLPRAVVAARSAAPSSSTPSPPGSSPPSKRISAASERVEVGGTQIERTATGAAVRVRDIVVRDPDGTIVASAPKAEIHVSGMSLFSGHMRAESLNLVGAAMAVRIEQDGNVTVFASGADKRPIATGTVPAAAAPIGRTRSETKSRPRRRAMASPAPARAAFAAAAERQHRGAC